MLTRRAPPPRRTPLGYGVFAVDDIKKGQFVLEYVGELVELEAAKVREREYSRLGQFYLHDVRGEDGQTSYVIDPMKYGNVGRMCVRTFERSHACRHPRW